MWLLAGTVPAFKKLLAGTHKFYFLGVFNTFYQKKKKKLGNFFCLTLIQIFTVLEDPCTKYTNIGYLSFYEGYLLLCEGYLPLYIGYLALFKGYLPFYVGFLSFYAGCLPIYIGIWYSMQGTCQYAQGTGLPLA